jgi:thioredoxin reductase
VKVFDLNSPWDEESSDPSITLSTYSFERIRNPKFEKNVDLCSQTAICSVELIDGIYKVNTEDGQVFESTSQPLFAGGFEGSHRFISHLFEEREDGFPLITENDESTIMPGLFLCGPSVRHDGHIFCFIFKYRQRFAIVAQAIASTLGYDTDEFVEAYRGWGMYLDDLSCCGQECLTC